MEEDHHRRRHMAWDGVVAVADMVDRRQETTVVHMEIEVVVAMVIEEEATETEVVVVTEAIAGEDDHEVAARNMDDMLQDLAIDGPGLMRSE